MNKNERPITNEDLMKALMNKNIIVQQSKPFRRWTKTELETLRDDVERILAHYY